MLPAHQLQGELAISVPRHRHPRATITAGKGWGICRFTHTSQDHRRAAPVRAQRGTQPRPPKAPCEATAVKTAWARTSPHLQRCDRGVDGPGAGDDDPPASAGLHTRHRRAAPVRAQRGTQPRPPKAPCEATAVKTAWARTSPHLQRCDRGVDGPGAGDDGPPAAGEGGHVACAPAAGRVSDFSTEAQAPARDNHRGQGMVSVLLLLNVFLHITVCPATLALNDLFAFLNILYCPRL
jgi:hypothetical protein